MMLKADVCVGCFGGVFSASHSPIAVSAPLGPAGGLLSFPFSCFLSPQNLENNINML